jgi:hypothetical protein
MACSSIERGSIDGARRGPVPRRGELKKGTESLFQYPITA